MPVVGARRSIDDDHLSTDICAYDPHHRIDALIGCASLGGIDPDRLALPSSFLLHHARAPDGWRARVIPARHVPMNLPAPK